LYSPFGLARPAKLRLPGFVLAWYEGAEQFALPIEAAIRFAKFQPCSSMSVAIII
jgi:hypothetical protein